MHVPNSLEKTTIDPCAKCVLDLILIYYKGDVIEDDNVSKLEEIDDYRLYSFDVSQLFWLGLGLATSAIIVKT